MSLPILRDRSASFHRSASSSLLPCAIAGILTVLSFSPAQAQDAKTILRDMLNTYRTMTSYRGRATVDTRQGIAGGKVLTQNSFTSTLVYRKPNRLKIEFAMPSGGRAVYFDGAKLTMYENATQAYTTTLVNAVDLAQLEVPLLRIQVGSKFDTLYFLSGKQLPPTVTSIARQADQTRGGKSLYVITGREADKTGKYTTVWTWAIDQKTHLLARVQGRVSNVRRRASFVQGKKRVTKDVLLEATVTQNIVDPVPNPKLDDSLFVFTPPPGAHEINLTPAKTVGKGQ